MKHETWKDNDPRKAFVHGAMWYYLRDRGQTMWPSNIHECEVEAEERYPKGKIKVDVDGMEKKLSKFLVKIEQLKKGEKNGNNF